jgi:hypothetical protein
MQLHRHIESSEMDKPLPDRFSSHDGNPRKVFLSNIWMQFPAQMVLAAAQRALLRAGYECAEPMETCNQPSLVCHQIPEKIRPRPDDRNGSAES